MLREEKHSSLKTVLKKTHPCFVKTASEADHPCFVKAFSEAIFRRLPLYSLVTLHNFAFSQIILSKVNTVCPSFAVCNMMYDAYAMRNDVMMLCYANDVCSEDTHKTHS
jgi:hypothetical protein